MSTVAAGTNEAHILHRAIDQDRAPLSVAAARLLLTIEFGAQDKARMRELAAKARAGSLSAGEQDEIDTYGRVGSLLSILKSTARKSLKQRGRA